MAFWRDFEVQASDIGPFLSDRCPMLDRWISSVVQRALPRGGLGLVGSTSIITAASPRLYGTIDVAC